MTGGTYRDTLRIRGLQPFLWTQFLGAFNDNVYKIIVSFYAMAVYGPARGLPLAAAVFVLPFLLFSGWAGQLADGWSKRRVLIATKALEIVAMALAIPALVLTQSNPGLAIQLQLGVLFLMATQSTFFSPAKYGILPETVPAEELTRANGLLEMSTFAAIILGTTVGGELFERWNGQPWRMGVVLVVIAMVGTLTSLGIRHVAAAKPGHRVSLNPYGELGRGLARLWSDRTLWVTAVGISYFWLLGTLFQQLLLPWGQETFGVGEAAATRLYTFLAVGIGGGSLLAGRLSGDKIEFGLVPLGSIGLGVFSLALAFTGSSYWFAAAVLILLGGAAGFFAVPLNALLQYRPAEDEKGRILATNNVLNTVGMLLAAAVFWWLGDRLQLSLATIILIAGAFTLAATVYVVLRAQDFFIRFVLWLLTHTIYRIRILGRPNVPTRGPALIVANHVSMIDGALVAATIQRFVRFMVYGPYFRKPGAHWLLERMHAIPVTAGNRREAVAAIERARAELEAGHVVCIFAEGAVSRTGNLLPFQRGFEHIVRGLDVPIVPVYLDRVWGSIFSFERGRFLWKLPIQVPYPVTIAWGAPLSSTSTATEVRQAIAELGSSAMSERRPATARLHTDFLQVARRHWRRLAVADTTGQRLTYGRTLMASLALGRVLRRRTPNETMVGILLPASAGGVLTNLALYFAGRVPVNLNFTIGREALEVAIAQAGIQTIITSRRFLEKAGLPTLPGMVFLEEIRKEVGSGDKAAALVEARLLPRAMVTQRYGPRNDARGDLATIIFSSGSTGTPKGVMLTHRNVLTNVASISQVFPMTPDDVFIGVLPLFHSFGFTGTMWFPLLRGAGVVYHPNPMDAKTIGEIAGRYKASMLISTPTFCTSYLRRCTPEQFAHLKYAIVGAEKLREPLRTEFREKYGVELFEGYGCTELSPVVAVNRPNVSHGAAVQVGTKPGSVGHPIPGVSAKVVHQDTGEELGTGEEGLLLIKGPNVMAGYLNAPERTADVMRDDWYVTGDIARIDEDGFIFITDRLSRFSKIGGEMVPHVKIEDALNEILGGTCSVVTAVPDAAKGERLVAFYTRADVAPDVLWERLCETDLPKIWIPKRENLVAIEQIPTLGTGKVDLRSVKQMAAQHAGLEVG